MAVNIETLAPDDAPAWRTLEYLALARVLVASALILSFAALGVPFFGRGPESGDSPGLLLAVTLSYFVAAAALAFAAFFLRRNFVLQVAAQLVVDMVLLTALMVATGGLRGGMMILYLLPLAGASLLLPTVAAFFVCALAVIAVLVDALVRSLQSGTSDAMIFQAGLYGGALFAITGLLRLLSARLSAQEELARLRGRDLENQLEINRLVIAQMEQGVIVVDATARVRANNRAARVLLGLAPNVQLTGQRLSDSAELRALADAFFRWLDAEKSSGVWSHSVMPAVETAGDRSGHAMPNIQVRARFARPPSENSDEYVIFLQDMRAVEERAQQLKLASMGRLTASIAHEIRNPLAAISHAGQLLGEETDDPLQQRLAGIVKENTHRLNRLVEDVLRVARREAPLGDDIELGAFVRDWLAEFLRDRDLQPERVRTTLSPDVHVKFEQSHLRQVLFNLVDNALRYASGRPGSVEVVVEHAGDDDGRARLWVFDDGPGVAPDARGALFEPFFTTHARGTGLGLYIAREFCIANRSDLGFGSQRQLDGSSRDGFMLRFARTTGGSTEDSGFLDTIPVF
jgi:two-component system sensor histidine kinase PilS (NtrC family)